MHITEPVEYLYLGLMLRWENSAPPDGRQGLLDGVSARNTQIARMAFVLNKVGASQYERFFTAMARHTEGEDRQSYISRDSSWMTEPYPLSDGWFFEGCTSLIQKQSILQHLTKLRLSSIFVACADDFVAGNSVKKYHPTQNEAREAIQKCLEMEAEIETYIDH